MSDTFDFVRENWRPMLKYITYLLLPVALVSTVAMDNFMTSQMSLTSTIGQGDMDAVLPWLLSMGVTMLFYFVDIVLGNALTYTMMQLYEQRQERLQGITFAELSPGFWQKCGRQLVLLVTGFVLLIVVGLIASPSVLLGPAVVILVAILLFIALPLIFLVQPIYLFEKISVVKAYAKSVRLGWKTWAGVVAVITVLYIIVSILVHYGHAEECPRDPKLRARLHVVVRLYGHSVCAGCHLQFLRQSPNDTTLHWFGLSVRTRLRQGGRCGRRPRHREL